MHLQLTLGGKYCCLMPRGGACFCTRVGLQLLSACSKVVVVSKNRDTIAGWPTPGCTNLSWWFQGCPGVESNCIYRLVVDCSGGTLVAVLTLSRYSEIEAGYTIRTTEAATVPVTHWKAVNWQE